MRLLREHRFGGRLHIVIAIRDIVMSSVHRSEHAPRYHNESHIRMLTWDHASLLYLLQHKLERLPESFLMRQPADGVSMRDWLGRASVADDYGGKERVEDYLIRHTRLMAERSPRIHRRPWPAPVRYAARSRAFSKNCHALRSYGCSPVKERDWAKAFVDAARILWAP